MIKQYVKTLCEAIAGVDLMDKLNDLLDKYNFEPQMTAGYCKLVKDDGNYKHEIIIDEDVLTYKCQDTELTLPIDTDINLQKTIKTLYDEIEGRE